MKLQVKVTEDGTGNFRMVQLASEEASRHAQDINRRVQEHTLWLPEGSEIFENQAGETCVSVPDKTLDSGKASYTLTEAYAVFDRYAHEIS